MELWQVIVAFIQGLVEWLPISSEGQLVLFISNFTAAPIEDILSLAIWLHLGTALAVIVRYPRTIFEVVFLKDRVLFRRLLVATVATAITAVPLYFFLKESLEVIHGELLNIIVGVLLLLTALVLYIPSRRPEGEGVDEHEPTDRDAVVAGLVQGCSVLPGLSRSGVTVSALLLQKVEKETALRFSFLMSVPAVLAILVLETLTGASPFASVAPLDLLVIEAVVFIVGLLSMEFLLRLARRVSFWKLCIIIAVIAIAFGIPSLL